MTLQLPTYSVAIRTLGRAGSLYQRELDSISRQTIQPEKIVVYIAEGYDLPQETIGREEYVYVSKGMVSQRALDYKEISSEYILLLDDDVELAPDAVETLLTHIVQYGADCIAADTFPNHKMTPLQKLYAVATNFVLPHPGKHIAFKIHSWGSFSYISSPGQGVYPSQSAAGPASLWSLSALRGIRYEDERWMDSFSFAYGDEMLFFYKLAVNGGALMVDFSANVTHLDGKTSRNETYLADPERFTTRAMLLFIVWWRTIYSLPTNSSLRKAYCVVTFCLKQLFCMASVLCGVLLSRSINPFTGTIKGLIKGYEYVHSEQYRHVPEFLIKG